MRSTTEKNMSHIGRELVIVRLHGLEVLANPGTLEKFRAHRIPASDCLAVEQVFTSATKGDVASTALLSSVTGQADLLGAAAYILAHGEYPETAEERRSAVDDVWYKTVEYIHNNYVDPGSGRPHSPTLIAATLSKVRFSPDIAVTIDHQVNNVYRAFNDRLRIIPAPDAKERVPLGGSMAPNLAEEGRAAKAKHSARRKSKSPGKSFPVS